MKRKGSLLLVFLSILLLLFNLSCSTFKKAFWVRQTGIKGVVIPVDEEGNKIIEQERENIIINCVPIREGSKDFEHSITSNAKSDGSFVIDLKRGEYWVEIFLEGFHVESLQVMVYEKKMKNLEEIRIRKIEAGSPSPHKGEETEESITNEGDVNIQPPS